MIDEELQAIRDRHQRAAMHRDGEDIAALLAEVDRLRGEVRRLTSCACGRDLSPGRCRVCDNDE
jgi:hypothetical protein